MDNWTCSANIKLLNEEMAEEVNAMEVFDLMEINCAMVEKGHDHDNQLGDQTRP